MVASCPVCGNLLGVHYILGSACRQFCDMVSCRDCGLTWSLRYERAWTTPHKDKSPRL